MTAFAVADGAGVPLALSAVGPAARAEAPAYQILSRERETALARSAGLPPWNRMPAIAALFEGDPHGQIAVFVGDTPAQVMPLGPIPDPGK